MHFCSSSCLLLISTLHFFVKKRPQNRVLKKRNYTPEDLRAPTDPRSRLTAHFSVHPTRSKLFCLKKLLSTKGETHCLTRRRSSISTVRIRMAYARKLPTKAAAYVFSFVSFSRSLFSQIIHGNLAAKIEEKTTKNLATRATTAHGCLDNYRWEQNYLDSSKPILTPRNLFAEMYKFEMRCIYSIIVPFRYVLLYAMHSAAYIPSSDWVKRYAKIDGGEAQSLWSIVFNPKNTKISDTDIIFWTAVHLLCHSKDAILQQPSLMA